LFVDSWLFNQVTSWEISTADDEFMMYCMGGEL
jgi:hypothetical protein